MAKHRLLAIGFWLSQFSPAIAGLIQSLLVDNDTCVSAKKSQAKSQKRKSLERSDKTMKTGIIGLPQVGKTSLFKILTKVDVSGRGHSNPREAHLGIAKVPDDRLDRLAAQYNPKKLTHAVVEYADVAAIGQEALKETAFLTALRTVDALAHVLRAFDDPSIPHVGDINPLRDAKTVDFDLIVSDLARLKNGWSAWKKT